MNRNSLLCIFITYLIGVQAPLFAQTKEKYVFAVTEGGRSTVLSKDAKERYKNIATDLSRQLGAPVAIEFVLDYKQLASGLAAERYDLAFIHPTQIATLAVESKKYRFVASEKSHLDYQVQLFVTANSPLKTLSDLKNPRVLDKMLIAPMEDSVTSAIARKMIKNVLGEFKDATYTNQEDNLPYASENGEAELGSMLFLLKTGLGVMGASASLSVINDWKSSGGRVIATSPKFPVKLVVANARLGDLTIEKLTTYFTTLDQTELGQKKLQQLGYAGFVKITVPKQQELIAWFK